MYVARVLYPVRVLGPGERIGIWFSGCEHGCKGCSNPELWVQEERYNTTIDTVMKLIDTVSKEHQIDGFTLTGGDPFFQPEALRELLPRLKEYSTDILCYSGYTEAVLRERYGDIVEELAVLIDGPYMEERNNNVFLRGSDNQNIIIISDEYKERYESYISVGHNEIQNFKSKDSVISVGIHSREYNKDLSKILSEKGLVEKM